MVQIARQVVERWPMARSGLGGHRCRGSRRWQCYAPIFALCLVALTTTGCSRGEPTKEELLARANAALTAAQFDKAEKEYRGVLARDQGDPVAIRQLGIIYYDQGQLPQASALLKKAAELRPDDAEVQLKLAQLLLSFGQDEQAREPARRILEKSPGEEGALLLLANTAVTPVEFQEIRKVIEDFRGADKDRAAYHVALGTLALREKDPAVAQREFNAALDLDSTSSAALAGLASIYWSLNQLPEAGRTFKLAADLSDVEFRSKLLDLKRPR